MQSAHLTKIGSYENKLGKVISSPIAGDRFCFFYELPEMKNELILLETSEVQNWGYDIYDKTYHFSTKNSKYKLKLLQGKV